MSRDEDALDAATMKPRGAESSEPRRLLLLTVLHHPDVRRVGEVARLEGGTTLVSRKDTEFASPLGGAARPLADGYLSRQPIVVKASFGRSGVSVRLSAPVAGPAIQVDGVPLLDERVFDNAGLARGVVLMLSERVVLCLHVELEGRRAERTFDLIGESAKLHAVRQAVERVAGRHVPVLLRGESGTGKELIARAIAEASPWAHPFVPVNMAAIPATVAASELFGADEGGFTDAVKHGGFFGRAKGGTLFLDEIGQMPLPVQAMLLRALEGGEVQAVGAREARVVKVRVIASTDADLEGAIEDGAFTHPLLQRLGTVQIRIPALRERREDLGRLLVHFLERELAEAGIKDRLDARQTDTPWLPATLVAQLARYRFPGNVRELRNLVRHLVIFSGDEPRAQLDEHWNDRLAGGRASPIEVDEESEQAAPDRGTASPVASSEALSDERVLAVVRSCNRNYRLAAKRLGVSPNTLYDRLRRLGAYRRVEDIPQHEVVEAGDALAWNWDAMAERLGVSCKALKDRHLRLSPDELRRKGVE